MNAWFISAFSVTIALALASTRDHTHYWLFESNALIGQYLNSSRVTFPKHLAQATLAYPGFYIGGCLIVCMRSAREKFADTPTFIDHTHQFKANTPTSRCALSKIKLTFIGLEGPRGSKTCW